MTTTMERPTRVRRAPAEDPGRKSPIRKFRPDIEGLRAVAVISVVLSHTGLLGFTGGFVGVDVFFVISGFLITRQLYTEIDKRGSLSFRGFYARRARRILPAATVVIVTTLLFVYRYGPPLRRRSIALDGLFSAFSGVNWRLASAKVNYFNDTIPPSPFQHFWSLAVEEQFYVIWPILLLLIGVVAAKRFGRRNAVIWTLLVIIGVSLGLSASTTTSSPSFAYFGTQTRAWELAVGALLAVTVDLWTRMRPALACQMSWAGIGMILTSIFVYTSNTTYPGLAVVLPVMGSAFVIAGGCPGWYKGAEFALKQRPMQWVGRVSYSWYLWHWPVLMVLPMYLGRDLDTADKWGVVFGSLALSVITYFLIEQPFRTNTFITKASWRSLASGATLVTTSVVVSSLIVANSIAAGPTRHIAPPTTALDRTALQAQIDAGAALTVVPADLTPSLAGALNDSPNAHGCFVGFDVTTPPSVASCTFGDKTATRSIMMVGDSHANSWFNVVQLYASENHYKLVFFAKGNCDAGVYLNQVINQLNRAYTECDTWRNNIFALASRIHPTYVLMASAIRKATIDPSGEVQAVQHFETAGAKVIYQEDTPDPSVVGSVPDCLAKHMSDAKVCDIQVPGRAQIEGIARAEQNQAVLAAGAHVINPTPWYCNATVCPAIINNILVYIDESHTSSTYTGWVGPEYDRALTAALR
jgi:peptidoglycan/LPS O-acetylase OafA/YrhL